MNCQDCEIVKDLKRQLAQLANNGKGDICPVCGDRMISLPSMNIKQCSNGHKKEFKLKPGQKSVLIEGLVGGIE